LARSKWRRGLNRRYESRACGYRLRRRAAEIRKSADSWPAGCFRRTQCDDGAGNDASSQRVDDDARDDAGGRRIGVGVLPRDGHTRHEGDENHEQDARRVVHCHRVR
jgi:hypothetical protein